jgi:hypothetical protein
MRLKRYETFESCFAKFAGEKEEKIDWTFEDTKELRRYMKKFGCWAWIYEKTIHYWADKNCSLENLILLMGHEITHSTGKMFKNYEKEEERAETGGLIAKEAYKLAIKIKNKP